MPHQTDIVERQANSQAPLTAEQRNALFALYDGGKPNTVGQTFAQACAGEKPTDDTAVTCLKGLGLVDQAGSLTDRGENLKALIL